MYIKSSGLYNSFLEIYYDEYNELVDVKKIKLGDNYDPESLFLKVYDSSVRSESKEESTDKEESIKREESVDSSDVPSLDGDEEEVKEEKGLKILTPNKLLTKLPILLAQIKAENNSYKLKNEIRQILYLLYQHNKITKKSLQKFNQGIIIMEKNMTVIRDPKTSCFNFDRPKDVDENLKHEIEFIIKSNESLAENKLKSKIEQLLLKYKHGNNIHDHEKQQNGWTT